MLKFFAGLVLTVLFVVFCIGLINIAIRLAPEGRTIDCGLAEFHPDYTNEIRKQCRERRSVKT